MAALRQVRNPLVPAQLSEDSESVVEVVHSPAPVSEGGELASEGLSHEFGDARQESSATAREGGAPESLRFRGFALDRFQAEAITHLTMGHSVLVSAPTGTGKTIIADYVVDQALREGREVVYTAPIKALSNQKYRDYCRLYGRDKIGLVTGDLVINRDAPIRIMTTEIMRNMLLQEECSSLLSHVVVDEVHFLEDEERGTVWEELLIYLPARVKIVALSATLPNIDEFAQWLEFVRGDTVAVVKEHRRAVPLRLLLANKHAGIVELRRFEHELKRWAGTGDRKALDHERLRERDRREGRGNIRGQDRFPAPHGRDARGNKPDPRLMTRHLDMIELVSPDYLPVLYFIFSRRQTELFARELSRRWRSSFLSAFEQKQVEDMLAEFEKANPGVLTPEHLEMYVKGVAFHHAGVHVSLKALVEELYEKRLIKILYCTSTFALGINMPARTVIFDSLRKFNGQSVQPLTVRQFLQKAGRAGRRGMDKVGYVVVREDFHDYDEDRPLFRTYQSGQHERIQSAFNLSFSSVVNLLARHSQEEIRKILEKSFLNFTTRRALEQQRDSLKATGARLEAEGTGARDLLKRWRKQSNKVERQLEQSEDLMYNKFVEKVDFLKRAGYLNDDLTFNAGAKALMHIQINEIFMTELILEGVFEEVDEDELFGLLTALVQDLPRSVQVREPLRGRWQKIKDRVKRIHASDTVVLASELIGLPNTFCPELMPYGQYWAQGRSLNELMLTLQSDVDISGDLVGAFRRARDLAGQLRTACTDQPDLADRLTRLMKKVARDEVEVLD